MKKSSFIRLGLFLSLAFVAVGCANTARTGANQKLTIYASVYPMYDFAVKLAGGQADVYNLMEGSGDPHDWEPTPQDIVRLQNADLFVYNGAGLEHWADSAIDTLKGTPVRVVEASQGLTLLQGDGQQDPHVWLDPTLAKQEMENIKNAMAAADPAHAAEYEKNFEHYAAAFDELDKSFADSLAPLPNKTIVVAHQAYGYLCDAYGLTQMPLAGIDPDVEPTLLQIKDVIDFVNNHQVKTVYYEEAIGTKLADALAKETGAQLALLYPIEGLTQAQKDAGNDYFSLMEANREALVKGLR